MLVNNSIGIMQGRLSPPEGNRLQFFPSDWEAEFYMAKSLGFGHIQWFLDTEKEGLDPIKHFWANISVLENINRVSEVIPISSVDCGFYPILEAVKNGVPSETYNFLLGLGSCLSEGIISIPLLEHKAPKSEEEKRAVGASLVRLSRASEYLDLRIAIETEMPAAELMSFVDGLGRSNVGVTYDLGNATSYGFDCPSEIRQLGKRIFEVHLKDRKIGCTQSVLLGTGDVDFESCFRALMDVRYTGGFTIQGWRGENFISDAVNQLNFVKDKLICSGA